MAQQPQPDPEPLLSLSAQLLGFRDFSGARKYALLAQNADPSRTEPPQIIAIVDILLAGLPDWASVLQLDDSMAGDRACMRSQFTKLLALVHPSKNSFPFCQEAFDHVFTAWSAMEEEKGEGGKSKGDSGTFWTVCPYCFYAYEYESAYEDCCLRCQNCRKGFHGLAVGSPPPVAEGNREEYYCGYGCFPLKYYLREQSGGGEGRGGDGGGGSKGGVKGFRPEENVMEISDDSSSEENGGEEKESERKKHCGSEGGGGASADNGQGSSDTAVRNGRKKGTYRKSILKRPRKMMGTGQGSKLRLETQDSDAKLGNTAATTVEGMIFGESVGANETDNGGYSDGDLEFFLGEDEVYVSMKNMG
ncbi:unnamed protein product [Linum tenue]|uniref:J domain-containing protein n=1 Tax=Linum tenue TaxID=586396 RepID=A0AAV0KG39_9ROSI|nr:unnamed protein product [Linum tenue]